GGSNAATHPNELEAFRWTQTSGIAGLGFLPGGTFSIASGVSADGSVVVGYSHSASGDQAFRWTQATGMVSLGNGVFASSIASGVSADGRVVVGEAHSLSGQLEAFRWTQEEGMVGLGGLSAGADAASADGAIIVGVTNDRLAFVWDSTNGTQDLREVLTSQGD